MGKLLFLLVIVLMLKIQIASGQDILVDSFKIKNELAVKDRFKKVYEKYIREKRILVRCSYFKLNNLSRAALTLEHKEAFDCLNNNLISLMYNKQLQRKYENLIGKEFSNDEVTLFKSLVEASDALLDFSTNKRYCIGP